ncbi:MAG TPA: hypothetical protein VGX68_02005 [Thermoanaerobaculia bacterium]|jgi:hypothetical protein|nr:hypothetical protein [Thermoanaerobaculia bacterium]
MMDDDVVNDSPEESEILRRLADLPLEAEPARDLWPEVAARIARPEHPAARSRYRVFAQAAAAALLLFAGGVAVGHRWGAAERAASGVRLARDPLAAAAEVQRTGTEYVAALRSLAECTPGPGTREQGREAALAAFYGAAHELVRLAPGDAGANEILDAVSSCREAPRPERPQGRTVRF